MEAPILTIAYTVRSSARVSANVGERRLRGRLTTVTAKSAKTALYRREIIAAWAMSHFSPYMTQKMVATIRTRPATMARGVRAGRASLFSRDV